MTPDNTPWQPVTPAALDWRDDDTPFSAHFDDVYYSAEDGLAETRHVFLDGNGLPGRWQNPNTETFCIAETGFGTGLNFLATWAAWAELPTPRPPLHYIAVEQFPLAPADLARSLARWPALAQFAEPLIRSYPGLVPGEHRLLFCGGDIRLDLWWHPAERALEDMATHGLRTVDAWYLDGFAPGRNSSMWTPAVFRAMAALSRPGATFATFTAAGQVRRDLVAANFTVSKRAGFGRKRECLHGVLSAEAAATPDQAPAGDETPWDLPSRHPARPHNAIVIGAGLAGASVAAALAARGVAVIVLERARTASGASANAQGVLYTRLPAQHADLTDFALQSYLHASARYGDLFERGVLDTPADGALCGAFAQHAKQADLERLQQVLQDVPELACVLSPAQAGEHLGVEPAMAGYWLPRSGWLNPAAVCRAWLDHPLITVVEQAGDVSLQRQDTVWQAVTSTGAGFEAPCAIIATGHEAIAHPALSWLPLQPVRGQTTLLPADVGGPDLRAVLCHEGYIAPARGGSHCIGATFSPGDNDPTERPKDHASNLAQLGAAVPAWRDALAQIPVASLSGTVGFRAASNDYLPIVGRVPDRSAFLADYADLRRNARRPVHRRGNYLDGLYVSTGHGSRGLTSTPLCAQWLAAQVCNEQPPLSRKLGRALSPARFIIRDLIRNRC
jgi:tRNA 5-methylaminomethyl-2-thiouridine biosynthesis bifunctional protein